MGILRSEPMQHGTLVLPVERAVEIVTLLGSKGCLQVQDMNRVSMRRPYRRHIQRIEEMERMLRYLTEEINKLPGAQIMTGQYEDFLEHDTYQLDGVEESLQTLYEQFMRFRENNDDLLKQRNRAVMEQAVARVAAKSLKDTHLPDTINRELRSQASQSLLQAADAEVAGAGGMGGIVGFSSFAGVVLQADQEKLSRTIFRATRGNAYMHVEPLEEVIPDEQGVAQRRNVFIVYYQGGVGSALHEKISRICQAFGIQTFDWPKSAREAEEKIASLQSVIEDKTHALEAFEEFFFDEIGVLLEPVRPEGNSLIEEWRLFCQKHKATYGCLNLFEETEATLRAECWYPAEEEEPMRHLLSSFSGPNLVSAFLLTDREKTRKTPPTYVKTTAFTECFQNVVDTYGVPRYQEANPALLTCITFPYLFGIMYGDIGHGAAVLAFGIFLVVAYPKLVKIQDEMTQMIAYGRYLILLMGIFAVFSGFIYNDFFGLGLDIFGTRWTVPHTGTSVKRTDVDFPYPFGVDPAWKGAENELEYLNSFKMKFAVIIAFIQMTVGVCLKGLNAIYWKDQATFWHEFIPQLIFIGAFVGYMDALIFIKWHSYPDGAESIIGVIIGMCMLKPIEPGQAYIPNQRLVENILLVLMVISIPWMLIPKPIILLLRHKRESKEALVRGNDEEAVPLGDNSSGDIAKPTRSSEDEEEPFEFGEVMIHQLIETIEYVLGVISNTASYLRLWALSLAHQQLALVFFDNIMLMILDFTVKPDGNLALPAIGAFLGFGVFMCITFAILLCMDSLECFLHALRLQWVEFQNKFYRGDGYKFTQFSYLRILSGVDQA